MLTEDQIQAIFDDLEAMKVELPPNADTLGPVFLQNKTLELRTHIGRAEIHNMAVLKERREVQARLRLLETEMELKYQDHMVNHPEVLRAPSVKDRETKAKYLLADLYRSILEAESHLADVQTVEVMIKTKLKELKELSSEIKLHRSLLRDSLDTGSFYGSETSAHAPMAPQRRVTERDLLPPGAELDASRQRQLDELMMAPVVPAAPDEGEEDFLRELTHGRKASGPVNPDS